MIHRFLSSTDQHLAKGRVPAWDGAVQMDSNFLMAARLEFNDPVVSFDSTGLFCISNLWGRHFLNSVGEASAVREATEKSGSLSVNRGAGIIYRVIRFENNHSFMFPHAFGRVIEWESGTTIHDDGIVVDVAVPSAIPLLESTEMVTFAADFDTVFTTVVDCTCPTQDAVEVVCETGPLSSTFTLDEISALDKFVTYGGCEQVRLRRAVERSGALQEGT